MRFVSERLNKFLAARLGISRRDADEMIRNSSVKVNDRQAELGQKIIDSDIVTVSGQQITKNAIYRYFLLHKPVGYVCSRKSQGQNPTIYSLLPTDFQQYKTVGRLDKDSSGLLILTNDGNFAHSMTHPKFLKNKTYVVNLDKPLEPLHHQMIVDYGISLTDGLSKFQLEKIKDSPKTWKVSMSEGRNRQIRRTFQALGYKVTKLHRTGFGPYLLNDLKSGTYEEFKLTNND
ncbi:rRNA pseudouridine synthase [bacterium]|nr:rRNA pseudouridine synthase [bacterium]